MWDDLPKKKISTGSKIVIIFLIIATIIVLGYVGIIIFRSNKTTGGTTNLLTPESNIKISGSPIRSPSLTSPTPSLLPSPIGSPNYQIPEDETYVMSSAADTNGDNKEETLVITKMKTGKYHVYVLSADGQSLFDNKELTKKPLRIATQTYDTTKEDYLSWMLIFSEQSGELAFIHWDGSKYEIPQSLGI